ncbi:SGNH/GDSL hydrolase family protein [Lipingzhangella sp. LS1_29]|uniref:SGNH/GDSL hydrolase family protein n=1 Tax=Lipingzhangella rawalii TaxID=2055835 RepID=A0ABU2H0D3_9ACTN|nr:SGNH/GDSL hydrolase family protein [Lipingzhangella rawalii]MDS1268773.1 SGNH/GDSL hydrolase family protein [Lipingzhangella rawalii]
MAIGDSFTEGLDDLGVDGEYRGFADRLAQHLAIQCPGFRYANLAVRGRRMNQICGEQLDQALTMSPDLVTVHAGGNDVLRPNTNLDRLAAMLDEGVRELRDAGIRVVILSGHDTGWIPVLRAYRGRIAVFSMHLRAIAERHACDIVDMWAMAALNDARAWSVDRLHFNAAGHTIVAARTAEVLGQPMGGPELWKHPWTTPALTPPPAVRRRKTLRWTYEHLVPWIGRRALGRSSGDGRQPKRPELTVLNPGVEPATGSAPATHASTVENVDNTTPSWNGQWASPTQHCDRRMPQPDRG